MKLKLLSPHIVPVGPNNDCWMPRGTVLDPPPPGYQATPEMEGLDEEGAAAVAYAKLKVWGRYPWPYGLYPPSGEPLDNPPIPRPLDDNQPVYHFVGSKEYLS
jgi:hypothetical protein